MLRSGATPTRGRARFGRALGGRTSSRSSRACCAGSGRSCSRPPDARRPHIASARRRYGAKSTSERPARARGREQSDRAGGSSAAPTRARRAASVVAHADDCVRQRPWRIASRACLDSHRFHRRGRDLELSNRLLNLSQSTFAPPYSRFRSQGHQGSSRTGDHGMSARRCNGVAAAHLFAPMA